ncbi:MAG: Calx-beta domain-containing protein, partial [Limisphaerales bacterium]
RVTYAGVFASLPNAYEGDGAGEFTFFLPRPALTNNTPLEFFLGGNVEPDFDFTLTTTNGTPASNVVYFAAGSSLSRLRVTPTNDTVQASRPGFVTATITNYSGGLFDGRTAVVNLVDNDPPTLSVNAIYPIAIEPEGLTNNGVFRFTRVGSNTTSLSFTFSLSGNTTNGIDYNTVSTTTNFAAGSNFVDVVIVPKTNNIFNGVRQVSATISANAAYTITNGSASIQIIDNDLPMVQVLATDPDARETGPKAGIFSLLRTGNTAAGLTVTVGLSGTASNSYDYNFLTNVFFIPPGTNRLDISVTPMADALVESNETVVITLKGSADYAIGVTNAATVWIDDSNPNSFSWAEIKQASAYHGSPAIDSPAVIEIYRSGSARLAANFSYQIYSNATFNMSYMRVYGNVTNNQIRFEANSNMARVFLTAAIAGNTDNNAGG